MSTSPHKRIVRIARIDFFISNSLSTTQPLVFIPKNVKWQYSCG
jgi:hypothetical protein